VLDELDPHGTVRQEYWSDGFIEFVAETSWNGRPVVLFGGTRNDSLPSDGSLAGAEISHEFQQRHALLERQGLVDHRFGPTDDREMFPVRHWDGRRFVELPGVPVAH
jgi:hypothetical protein